MSIFTVENLMSLHPFDQSQVIAGFNGLNRNISYMGVLDAPDSVQFVKKDEFVMSSGFIFSDNEDLTVEIIKELCTRESSGLGIKMFRYISALPEKALKIANENNFPILFVPNKYSWHELITPFIQKSIMFEKEEALFSNIKLHDALLERLSKCKTYYDVVTQASDILDIPIGLFNVNTMKLLLAPPNQGENCVIDKDIFLDNVHNLNSKVDSSGIHFSSSACSPKTNIIFSPLNVDQYTHIIFFNSPDLKNAEELNNLIYSMVLVRNFVTLKSNAQQNLIDKISGLLKEALLNEKLTIAELINQANNLGVKPFDNYYAIICKCKDANGKTRNIVHPSNKSLYYNLGFLFEKYSILSHMGSNNEILFLVPLKTPIIDTLNSIQQTRKTATQIKNLLNESFSNTILNLGIGSIMSKSKELISAFKVAIETLQFGEILFGDNQIIHNRDINIYRLLFASDKPDFSEEFLKGYLNPLLSLDEKESEKLIETFTTYVESYFNARECGRHMGIHYNTVRYRLDKIFTLTGLDPYNYDDLFILQACFYIMKLLKLKERRSPEHN